MSLRVAFLDYFGVLLLPDDGKTLSHLIRRDENLMQKNLKEFAAKDPGKALKYGIKFDCNKYHRTSMKGREDLDRDKSERKFFSNQKERDEKKRERGEKEKGTNLERKNLSWAVQRRSESTLVKCFFVENASELQLAALRLVTTEWPSFGLLLSLLGQLLVSNFVTKTVEMSLRVASFDYLGVVAAKPRKDAVTSHKKNDLVDDIIKDPITD
ncbi:hypothetical protein QYM36_011631 [Artemia franciscana]|uniref:Uncharacterized protein n=1 Tax=Artemia franciscana TaxID=6661 RepID=A0AA88L4X1_ARTSF|nr:hypothetical protein QYM36_011631 [Artemia franciscana]